MTNETNPTTGGIKGNDVERLRKQVKDLRKDLQELGLLAKGAAREKMDAMGDSLHSYYDEGRERYDEYEDQATDLIRSRPFQSVLVALGVGFLLSLIFGRR